MLYKYYIKRAVDITVSLIMILILSPLIIVVSTIIKLHGCSVFFIHSRVGINGKLFPLIKFRTMVPNSEELIEQLINNDKKLQHEWYANFKLQDDPRVTKFGYFLRETKIDEIPQFFNVLLGHMSIVGPRPLTSEEFDKKFKSLNDVKIYQSVLPGITGCWQVNTAFDYNERILMEINYISDLGYSSDIKIMLLTVKKILKGIFRNIN